MNSMINMHVFVCKYNELDLLKIDKYEYMILKNVNIKESNYLLIHEKTLFKLTIDWIYFHVWFIF